MAEETTVNNPPMGVGGMYGPKAKLSVYEALALAMGDVQKVGKDSRNADQGYVFRGIDAVVNAVGPAFRKHGIVPVPVTASVNYRDVTTSRGKPSRECTVLAAYRFYGPAGDYVEAVVPGESMDFGDKGAPKAMSVAYRIALLQVLCIPTDDADPDAESYERADPSPEQQVTQEQGIKAAELMAAVEAAADAAALKDIGGAVVKAKTAGDITPWQYDRLARRASERLAGMEP